MTNENATLRSLQELKTLFDSGAITPEEYESLKKRIIYGINSSQPQPAPTRVASATRSGDTQVLYPTPNATSQPVVVPSLPVAEPTSSEQKIPSPVQELSETDAIIRRSGLNAPEAATAAEPYSATESKPAKRKDWLLITLGALGTLLLLALLAYQLFNKPESERLTSKSGPDLEEAEPAVAPEATATAPAPEVIAAPTEQPGNTGADSATITSSAPASVTTVTPAPPVTEASPTGRLTDENEIIQKATAQLQAYYQDMQAPPFNAADYFAPRVERYYTLINTIPTAITKNINSYHFSEFLNGKTVIQDGSMQVKNSTHNGYELTYLERGSAFRKSRNQQQATTSRVRVKFDLDFKIAYFRQEQLLENKFTDVAAQ